MKIAAATPPTIMVHTGTPIPGFIESAVASCVGAAIVEHNATSVANAAMSTPITLPRIVEHKRGEVAAARVACPLEQLQDDVTRQQPPRNFFAAVSTGNGPGGVNVIAEVKRQSPSAGVIREDFDPVDISLQYENAGAVAISCLTDKRFFGGSLSTIGAIKKSVRVPVLRKDFLIDQYQIWEARAAGADAVLLISECLSEGLLMDMLILTHELGMTALVEVHDMEHLLRALQYVGFPHPGYMLLGINNRNLATMKTDISHTIRMLELAEEHLDILVTESGIKTPADVEYMVRHGVRRFLVGESLLKHDQPGDALRALVGTPWS
jgi:indole-3-glycerol phosphate synthase